MNICFNLFTPFRLCEELEYSDLLDNAASSTDSIERMTYVAAFAISGLSYFENFRSFSRVFLFVGLSK